MNRGTKLYPTGSITISNDSGKTWTVPEITTSLQSIPVLSIDPGNQLTLGNDGGLYLAEKSPNKMKLTSRILNIIRKVIG